MKESLLNLVDLATDFGVEGFALNDGIAVDTGAAIFSFGSVGSISLCDVPFHLSESAWFWPLSVLQLRS